MSMLRRPIVTIGLCLFWIAVSTVLMMNGDSPVSVAVDPAAKGRYGKLFVVTAEERYELELALFRTPAPAGEVMSLFKTPGEVREAEVSIPVRWSMSSLGGDVVAGGEVDVNTLVGATRDADYLRIGQFQLPRGVYRFVIEVTGITPAVGSYLGEVRSSHHFMIANTKFSVAVMLSFVLSIYVIAPFLVIYSIRQVWRRIKGQPRMAA